MFREVRADGFRSLDSFSMAVRPGLNVLVGPNGGGKTNILALFSFISTLAHEDVSTAISSSGGVSKVFKKLGEGSFQRHLKVGVTSTYNIDESRLYLPPKYRTALSDFGVISIDFLWDCWIDASNGFDQTFFSRQELSVRVNSSTDGASKREPYDFKLIIESAEGGVIFKEEIIDHERAFLLHQSQKSESDDYFTIDEDRLAGVSVHPIFFIYDNVFIFRWMAYDLRRGTTFNFDPAACKKSNDSARTANLEKDGTGLAAVVYAMQKADFGETNLWAYNFEKYTHFEKDSYQDLLSYFRLINRSMVKIEAQNDAITNSITLIASVDAGEGDPVTFPLEFASDGTVKWLAFNVALLTQKGGFSIEEPENFLHPDIQRHAVELVRTEIGIDSKAFVLMTTHSESLLNAAKPDEIIVISMNEGVTAAKRISDPHLISEEIRETGFGLGYYYLAGAFSE